MKKLFLVLTALFLTACATTSSQYVLQDAAIKKSVYEAIKDHRELIAIGKESFKNDPSDENRLALAMSYYNASDLKSALYYASALLKTNSPGAHILVAKIKDAEGDLKGAEKQVKVALTLDSKNANAHNVLGIIQSKLGKFDESQRSFYKAKELFLSDEIVDNNLGLLEIARGRYKEASSYLYPLYSRGYGDKKIVSNLILALAKSNQDELALRVIRKEGLSSNPQELLKSLKNAKK